MRSRLLQPGSRRNPRRPCTASPVAPASGSGSPAAPAPHRCIPIPVHLRSSRCHSPLRTSTFPAVVGGWPRAALTHQRFCWKMCWASVEPAAGSPGAKAEDNLRPAGKENTGFYTCERDCFFLNKINHITRVERRLHSYFTPVLPTLPLTWA